MTRGAFVNLLTPEGWVRRVGRQRWRHGRHSAMKLNPAFTPRHKWQAPSRPNGNSISGAGVRGLESGNGRL